MKPNTPHLVVTPQSSICHGGHYYATSTIRQTCHGIMHTFVACSLLTNTEHTTASRELLRRILFFYFKAFRSNYVVDGPTGKTMSSYYKGNVPDIFTFEGLLDVLSLCNLMELGNIIHHQTYAQGGLDDSERVKMILGRACARQVRKWLETIVEIHHPHEVPSLRSLEQDVFYPYLCSQTASLLHYKKRAPLSNAQGHVKFSLQDLTTKIKQTFFDDPKFMACYHPAVDRKTFDWIGTTYHVRAIEGYREYEDSTQPGETPEDLVWLNTGDGATSEASEVEGENPRKRARI